MSPIVDCMIQWVVRAFSVYICDIHALEFNCVTKTQPNIIEPVHEISNNVVSATSKAPDQPAHTRSLIRAFACRLNNK